MFVILFSSNDQNRLLSAENLIISKNYTANENVALSQLKCQILNEQYEDGCYQQANISYCISFFDSEAVISIDGEYSDIFYILFLH